MYRITEHPGGAGPAMLQKQRRGLHGVLDPQGTARLVHCPYPAMYALPMYPRFPLGVSMLGSHTYLGFHYHVCAMRADHAFVGGLSDLACSLVSSCTVTFMYTIELHGALWPYLALVLVRCRFMKF